MSRYVRPFGVIDQTPRALFSSAPINLRFVRAQADLYMTLDFP